MQLEGILFYGNRPGAMYTAHDDDTSRPFHLQMEHCLLEICKSLAVPLPIWMKKNTRELGAFHQTVFTSEQFLEPVHFDRFILRLY